MDVGDMVAHRTFVTPLAQIREWRDARGITTRDRAKFALIKVDGEISSRLGWMPEDMIKLRIIPAPAPESKGVK